MAIQIKPLPFADNALEPVISSKTISHHYYKHHVGYVNKLNALLTENALNRDSMNVNDSDKTDERTLDQILNDEKGPNGNIAIWNNAAQHFNHEFYWESLTPTIQKIPAELEEMIIQNFGSVEDLHKSILEMAVSVFGSGWVWLTVNSDNAKLQLEKTSNANFPEHKPILVVDVWEHAYYLDYQQDRASHIKDLLKHLNWEKAFERLKS